METTYQIGRRHFCLDKTKAEAAFAAKRVINGRETMTFNLLPLRYEWAYNLYKDMKACHWGPKSADIQMHVDAEQWRSTDMPESERWSIMMTIGWLAAARKMPGADIQHAVRAMVTAPELKLVLGRETQDDNIRLEALLYSAFSLGTNTHQCEAMFMNAALIEKRRAMVARHTEGFSHKIDLTKEANRRLFAKSVFIFGQCVKGLQCYGLLGMVMNLRSQHKFPGFTQTLAHILRDEAHHIEVFGNLFLELGVENPEVKEPAFRNELITIMREFIALEKEHLRQCLPQGNSGLCLADLEGFIDHVADCRLRACELPSLNPGAPSPLPWLAETMHLRHRAGTSANRAILKISHDDDL